MQYKRILEIVKYSSELYREGLVKKGDAVSMRTVDGILISDPEKALEEIAAEDVLKIKDGQETSGIALLHREIYNARPEINAIVTNHAQYSLALSEMVKKIPRRPRRLRADSRAERQGFALGQACGRN